MSTQFRLPLTAAATACNPPPPARTVNPPEPRATDERGVPLDLRADEVFKDDDGTCFYEQDVDCPEDPEISCNPPAPIEVDCPDGA